MDFIGTDKRDFDVYLVDSNIVNSLRKEIRYIYSRIFETDSENIAAGILRLQLLKLQTSPSELPTNFLAESGLGNKIKVQAVWGTDVALSCGRLEKGIEVYREKGSLLTETLVDVVTKHLEDCPLEEIKIWCHKNEVEVFQSLFADYDVYLEANNFISSLAEYKASATFEMLVRIGPLRSQGWSKTPKVILSSPRYNQLLQFIWSGSFDEEGFGADPIIVDSNYLEQFSRTEHSVKKHIEYVDEGPVDEIYSEVDDFIFLKERPMKAVAGSSCILVELPNDIGVLLAPNASQLIYKCGNNTGLIFYQKANELENGSFILTHNMEIDVGDSSSGNDCWKLAKLWKKALNEMYKHQYQYLIMKMEAAGINLKGLDRAAQKWVQFDGGVICGPLSKRHFQLLIEAVLPTSLGDYSWRQAWREIEESRVQAIKDGRIESSIINEELVDYLTTNIRNITDLCDEWSLFSHDVCLHSGLVGTVKFYPVISVSDGFNAPIEKFGEVESLVSLERFRTNI